MAQESVVYSPDSKNTDAHKSQDTFIEELLQWTWVFIILCLLLTVLGGVIPVLIGLGGAVANILVARRTKIPYQLRLKISAVITVACWFITFIYSLTMMLPG
jgi:hypothetical protein